MTCCISHNPSLLITSKNYIDVPVSDNVVNGSIKDIITSIGLVLPASDLVGQRLPKSMHCVSMSLHMLKNLQGMNITADHLEEGVKKAVEDLDPAAIGKTSQLYNAVFEANQVATNLVYRARDVAIKSLGLSVSNHYVLKNYTRNETIQYLKTELPNGAYLMPMKCHLMAVIKSNGVLYVYDPNKGVIKIDDTQQGRQGEKWLLKTLTRNRIELKGHLELLQLHDKNEDIPYQLTELEPTGKDALSLIKQEQVDSRWERITWEWRGKSVTVIHDTFTGRVYNSDSKGLIAFKFILLFFATPLFCVIGMVYHAARFVFGVLAAIFSFLPCVNPSKRFHVLTARSFCDIFRTPWYRIKQLVSIMWNIGDVYLMRAKYDEQQRELCWSDDYVPLKTERPVVGYHAPCMAPINLRQGIDSPVLTDTMERFHFLVGSIKSLMRQQEYLSNLHS